MKQKENKKIKIYNKGNNNNDNNKGDNNNKRDTNSCMASPLLDVSGSSGPVLGLTP